VTGDVAAAQDERALRATFRISRTLPGRGGPGARSKGIGEREAGARAPRRGDPVQRCEGQAVSREHRPARSVKAINVRSTGPPGSGRPRRRGEVAIGAVTSRTVDRDLPGATQAPEGLGLEHLRSLGWSSTARSPISSRKMVPRSATARTTPASGPSRSVNAPFSWPKSSESRKVDDSPAQLTSHEGSWPGDSGCGSTRTHPFPVPLSPTRAPWSGRSGPGGSPGGRSPAAGGSGRATRALPRRPPTRAAVH